MNQRNVDELTMLLRRVLAPRFPRDPMPREVAQVLAADGVLVPSALTDDQVRDLTAHGWDSLRTFRNELERIAKGEP